MDVMNKWLIALSSLVVLMVLAILGLYISPYANIFHPPNQALPTEVHGLALRIPPGDYKDSDGLTSSEKMNAIAIALNNSIIEKDILNNANVSKYIVFGNVTSVSAGLERGIDSGFLNMSSKIAYATVGFSGAPHPQFSNDYVVYADLTNNRTLGCIAFEGQVSPVAYVTIPASATWYTQVYGSTGAASGKNEPAMVPYYIINKDDLNSTSMMILSKDNFTKFKEGLSYTPLTYVDFWTNETIIADGKQPLKASILNGTAICGANVSFGNSIPPDANDLFPNLYYYALIANNNKDKEIDIQYMNG